MHSSNVSDSPKHVKGWILDIYPSAFGEVTVWIIAENGERIRLTDEFKPKIYISGKEEDIERLASQFFNNRMVASWNFAHKYASATDAEKSKVLEVELRDCRTASLLTRRVLEMGRYLQYQVHNCDLRGDQAYLYDRDIFPLAFAEVEVEQSALKYDLLDYVESVDYQIPPLRIMKIHVDVAKRGKIANLNDPIDKIVVNQADNEILIDFGKEREQLLQLVDVVKELDPDIVLTRGGDSYLFPYLTY